MQQVEQISISVGIGRIVRQPRMSGAAGKLAKQEALAGKRPSVGAVRADRVAAGSTAYKNDSCFLFIEKGWSLIEIVFSLTPT